MEIIEKDEKNLKRRIYGSLNIMKSLKVIERDKKKDIIWNYDAENDPLKEILKEEDEKDSEYISTEEDIEEKKKDMKLLQELIGFTKVLERNKKMKQSQKKKQKFI